MTQDNEQAQEPAAAHADEDRRKPYTPPTLTLHGPVEVITGLIGAGAPDGIIGS